MRAVPTLLAIALPVVAAFAPAPVSPELWREVEVIRTAHGVPHIRAENLRAAGYALAAKQLRPALCNALGEFIGGTQPEAALESRSADGGSLLARVGSLSRLWRRSTGVPAPVVV